MKITIGEYTFETEDFLKAMEEFTERERERQRLSGLGVGNIPYPRVMNPHALGGHCSCCQCWHLRQARPYWENLPNGTIIC
jgi:hypothetical protein